MKRCILAFILLALAGCDMDKALSPEAKDLTPKPTPVATPTPRGSWMYEKKDGKKGGGALSQPRLDAPGAAPQGQPHRIFHTPR